MFDHRLAQVMHQDYINSSEMKRSKKSAANRKKGLIARLFSRKRSEQANPVFEPGAGQMEPEYR